MNKIFTLFAIFIAFNSTAQETKKALFIGNSYTNANNLPVLIENLAINNGDILIHDKNTPGGMTFNGHSTNATTLNKIASDDWDYVVLQAQSQEPSFPPGQVSTQTKPYAAILNDSVFSNNECTNTMFFMTWGRENGDASNCAFYTPLCTYEGMQQRLRESYLEMADENDASAAPVGMAWKKVREDFPSIGLYTSDGSHPNINGSYLAACVFYSSMFHKSTVGNTFTSTLDSLTAFRLQTIASSTVLDSLDVWMIDTAASVPVIEDSLISACDSTQVNSVWFHTDTAFSDTIVYANPCKIKVINYEININNIGDAKVLVFEEAIYLKTNSDSAYNFFFHAVNVDSMFLYRDDTLIAVYPPSNQGFDTFNIFLPCTDIYQMHDFMVVVKNACSVDTSYATAFCDDFWGAIGDLNSSNWQISPNPTNNFITIESKNNKLFFSSLKDISGREVIEKTKDYRIDLSSLDKGIYFIVLYDENGNAIGQKKVIKQ